MKKQSSDFVVINNYQLPSGCAILTLELASREKLPEILPGQFVQIKVDAPGVFLRRPISVCDVRDGKQLVLFVKPLGTGSTFLTHMDIGHVLNIIYPLGNGFSCSAEEVAGRKILLVGGGVGAAPLVYLSKHLSSLGTDVHVALGGRASKDLDGLSELYPTANSINISTDDGSLGEKGVITENSIFSKNFDRVYCCGPLPMMKAVARKCSEKGTWCEVSLENRMACGIGACLCCVEDTSDKGNVCVCTEGPVFNIKSLEKWL